MQARGYVQLLLLVGAADGLAGGLIASSLPVLAPQWFTSDAAVWPYMASIAPQVR